MNRISILFFSLTLCSWAYSQEIKKAPEVKEGNGPYTQLIIRGIILIDGTGAPPIGPVDIVVKQNRITQIQTVGYPGVAINADRRPKLESGGKELDCTGMYLM